MGIFGGPKVPDVPAPPPAAAPATLASPDVASNEAARRNRDLAAAGAAGTLGTTGPGGISTAPPTAKASLLGEGGGR